MKLICTIILLLSTSIGWSQIDSTRLTAAQHLIRNIEEEMEYGSLVSVSIAIVDNYEPLWVGALGYSDLVEGKLADEHSMYRIASISKMFVAIAIMKLEEEGKLSLNDPIKKWVPEVAYENQWEDAHPIRVVHLLEHTTGWDDLHFSEAEFEAPADWTLEQRLAYHPDSRTSRWVPGTRHSYCNSGYTVATMIIEKVSGQDFTTYIADTILEPLGMLNATYDDTGVYQEFGAKLYDNHQNEFGKFSRIHAPSAGGLLVSAKEMSSYLMFLLQNPKMDSLRIINKESLLRMRLAETTAGYRAGLKTGAGLGNYTYRHDGHLIHGHSGGTRGAMSQLYYHPESGRGYFLVVSGEDRYTFQNINRMLTDFLVEGLAARQETVEFNGKMEIKEGFYVRIDPRHEWANFIDNLLNIDRITLTDSSFKKESMLPGKANHYKPITATKFRSQHSPVADLVITEDPIAGTIIYTDSQILKPVSIFRVYSSLGVLGLWIGMMALSGIVWFFTLVIRLFGKKNKALTLLSAPVLVSVCFAICVFMCIVGWNNREWIAFQTPFSVALYVVSLTLLFAAFTSVFVFMRNILTSGKVNLAFAGLMIVLHMIAILYLAHFDTLPLMTWK